MSDPDIEVVEILVPQPIQVVQIEVPGLQGPSDGIGKVFVGDGADQTEAFQAAIDDASGIFRFIGHVLLSSTILLPGDFLVRGYGTASKLSWVGGDFPVLAQQDYADIDAGGNNKIILEHFLIDDNDTVRRINHWTVDLSNAVDCWIKFVEIQCRTTGSDLSDLYGILMGRKEGSAYPGNVWENHLETVNIRRGKAWICDSDGSIVNCQLHGISRDYALRIGAANRVTANYILGGETFGGLYIHSTDNSEIFGAEIVGNHFDGTVRRPVPHSIFAPAAQKVTGLIIEGGTARYNDAEGVRLENAERCKVVGMNFDACDALDEGKPDVTMIGSTDGSWNLYADCTHGRGIQATKTGTDLQQSSTRVNLGYAVEMTGKDDLLIPGTVGDNYRSQFFGNGTNPTERSKFQRFDDFDGATLGADWVATKGSDVACAMATPIVASGGAVRLTFGAHTGPSDFTNNHSQIYRQFAWRSFATGLFFEAVITPSSVGSQAWFLGLTAQVFSDKLPFTVTSGGVIVSNCTDGCGVVFDTAGPIARPLLCGVKADVDTTLQDSGVTLGATDKMKLRIEWTIGAAATFFINGNFVGDVMTQSMTSGSLLTPYFGGFSRSNVSKYVDIDYIDVGQNRE